MPLEIPPATLLSALMASAQQGGTRALLVIDAPAPRRDPQAAVARVNRPVATAGESLHTLTSGQTARADRADRLTATLGTERLVRVHDARTALDPAMLAAELGTIRAGGALVLITSPATSRFEQRFANLLGDYIDRETAKAAPIAACLETDGETATRWADALINTDWPGQFRGHGSDNTRSRSVEQQNDLLAQALSHLADGARPLVVIDAPRGHGKSALLGRLAAALESSGVHPVTCSAQRAGIKSLERHREATLRSSSHPLAFLPPDAAVSSRGDFLLVDEAASLPIPILIRLLERWEHVVMATTSAGYENAGRAFALRLPGILDTIRPGWLRLIPRAPFRWNPGDPLHALMQDLTLADPDVSPPSLDTIASPTAWPVTEVERDALLCNEPQLKRLYSLLMSTHYQTTPLDLAHLLDAQNLRVWMVADDHQVLGVALVAMESGICEELHEDVLAKRRRLQHCLLPQLLAQSANSAQALSADCARIVRIAVHPDVRRRGVARRMVEAIGAATRHSVEAVGASFGDTSSTSAFWSACGFTAFHRGYRKNPRSGHHSSAVLLALSSSMQETLAIAAAIHTDNLRAGGVTDKRDSGNDSVDVSGSAGGSASADAPVTASGRATGGAGAGAGPSAGAIVGSELHDQTLLRRFARNERSVADTQAALMRWAHRRTTHLHDPALTPGGNTLVENILTLLEAPVPPTARLRERELRALVAATLPGSSAASDNRG